MAILTTLFLLDMEALMQFDILVWVVGAPLIAAAVALLFMQRSQTLQLKEELDQLAKLKRHTIEYELVLKTMKLSVWRLDVPTLTFHFESDYRDAANSVIFPAGTSVDTLCESMVSAYVEPFRKSLDNLISGKTDELHEQYEIKVPHSDETYWSETYATVDKRDAAGLPLTVVGTSMRIDRQKAIERDLIEARNHAEESDRLKSAFLANMSHEVRTPLNAIVGFSDVLPMAESDEERQQLIGLIKENNAHLLRLFDDMVRMSKLEAGGEAVRKTRFPLRQLMEDVVKRYMYRVDPEHVQLGIQRSPVLVEPYTDRERLEEILNQFVDNAVKFTTEGNITLGFEVHEKMLRVWVRDTGKGIPEEFCDDRLFERFVKVDEFVPGTGLGLSICRSIALSLDGKVGVESVMGEGSLFWAEIPFA